jgi:hypothetical protein
MAAAGRGDRLLFRAGAETGQDFPGGEAADELGMAVIGDAGEVSGKPPFERADLFVYDGEHTAGHQELPQVGGGPPGLEAMECLMGLLARVGRSH